MDKQDIFAQIHQLEEQMGMAYADLSALKQRVILLLEENQRLSIENQQLRKVLKEVDEETPVTEVAGTKEPVVPTSGGGIDNLARLYQEGFHICNVYYGHLRTEGDCLFCLSFLKK
ncbi:DNA replication initiation control protein YabA [Paenibacillus sp. N1-5-1-14]|uniref:DNA replication initiation control protein YabA n=1 Tax=Paenibacillus radicibacter TaxID=2972488 RepID=UPI00215978C0|nr:DNA replication initiation control protein YabA [Paenibacillus radicibacter]MCR8645885.1 DNA replication initiation control protein YabA [Paenibacillus radicibacter]